MKQKTLDEPLHGILQIVMLDSLYMEWAWSYFSVTYMSKVPLSVLDGIFINSY
jgi:hypothetical protein